jgi:hypothetical protein
MPRFGIKVVQAQEVDYSGLEREELCVTVKGGSDEFKTRYVPANQADWREEFLSR